MTAAGILIAVWGAAMCAIGVHRLRRRIRKLRAFEDTVRQWPEPAQELIWLTRHGGLQDEVDLAVFWLVAAATVTSVGLLALVSSLIIG